MNSCAVIIAGFGGQGILYMGQMLAYAANECDQNVCWLPSYGPEMRGGTANCMVTFSDEEVYSPMILAADVVVAMNKPSMVRFERSLRPGGTLLLNTDMVDEEPTRTDIRVVRFAGDSIAERLGDAKAANMAALGTLLGATGAFPLEEVERVVAEQTPESKRPMLDLNLKALRAGYAAGRGEGV